MTSEDAIFVGLSLEIAQMLKKCMTRTVGEIDEGTTDKFLDGVGLQPSFCKNRSVCDIWK